MTLRILDTDLDSPHIKSYATEANLLAAIEKIKTDWAENDDRFIVVRTPLGRWTAIVVLDKTTGGYMGRYPFLKV